MWNHFIVVKIHVSMKNGQVSISLIIAQGLWLRISYFPIGNYQFSNVIMGVNKIVEKCDRYINITCNSEDWSGCWWSNLMILLAKGSSRHGEGYCPGLSWIFRHLLSRCSEWSLGRERHRGQVTMSSARTQLSSHHRCYNFSWVGSLWRAEAWDRWPGHTGRAATSHEGLGESGTTRNFLVNWQ